MVSRTWTGGVCAFVTAAALTVSAQEGRTAGQDAAGTDQGVRQVTLVGCVELEKDYRARIDAGRGGVLGTGIGAGNEFVLTNARPAVAGAQSTAAGSSGSRAGAPAGTTGGRADAPVGATGSDRSVAASKAGGSATGGLSGDYSLTGKLEGELVRQVGRMVEVIGTVEDIESHDSADDARDLPELTVETWHTRNDFCPPGSVTEPAGAGQQGAPAGAQPRSGSDRAPAPQSGDQK